MSKKKTQEEFIDELATINPRIEIIGEYISRKKPIHVRCKDCGNDWNPTPNSLLDGALCLRCSYKKRGESRELPFEVFQSRLAVSSPSIRIVGNYEGMSRKVLVECQRCGHRWEVIPSSLLRGHGCPACKSSGTSYLEQVILLSLRKLLGDASVKHRNKTAISKELDIYVPTLSLAIEPGSWFFHKKKSPADQEKQQLCARNNIKLITIYDSYDGPDIDSETTWHYKENLGTANSKPVVMTLISRILAFANIPNTLSPVDWNYIEDTAHLATKRLTQQEFEEKLSIRNPNIIVMGQYKGMKEGLQVQCRKCGHIWCSIPTRLLTGYGCRKCGREIVREKLKKTHEQFVAEMAVKNPSITILSTYSTNKERITVKCNECGYVWDVLPTSIYNAGHGCPACWNARRGKNQIMTEDEFLDAFSKKGKKDIIILGHYKSSNIPILVRCAKCGREWNARPSSLLCGHGCIKCAGVTKKTHEEFIQELEQINPKVKPLEPYKGADQKIKVLCCVCSNEWFARPTGLLKGNGCPNCARKRRSERQRRTTEQYKEELSSINPNIEVLDPYINANTPSLVRCNKCKYEWKVKPSYFLNLHGECPICRKHNNREMEAVSK